MSEETPKGNAEGLIEFSIKHPSPPLSQYSNHMLVQGDAECLYLHFFQLRPPVIIPNELSRENMVAEAAPVASIAIDLAKAQNFIDVMQTQLARLRMANPNVRNSD